ncbi:MAG TPA: DUF1844 domain-containing protein [Actinomycetota bacterium]|nr:DUF1844 domain-containing protein [Actinomycetota bacterium]HJW58307.1 DUF1844 domain-containing protein [Actinomycetota bacterium]
MSEQDLTPDQLEQLREQLASVSAGDVVAEAALSLIALAYVRLGIPPEQHERFRDLDDARLLVDALGGMLVATEGRLGAPEASLRDALANLRMTFADVSAHLEAHPDGDPAGPDDPEDSGILRPPSGLWVPGQD